MEQLARSENVRVCLSFYLRVVTMFRYVGINVKLPNKGSVTINIERRM